MSSAPPTLFQGAWRDTGGNTTVWLMHGAQLLQSGGLGTIPTSFAVVGQRDFNGDGMSDILWLDTSGNVAVWFMNGAAVSSTAGLGNVGTTWPPQFLMRSEHQAAARRRRGWY